MTGSQGAPLLEVENLTTHYPVRRGLMSGSPAQPRLWVHAVDGVSFTLARGEMLALVGESGCGKTTTAQTILGMVEPPAGTIRLNGHRHRRLPERQLRPLRRQLQMIYQDPYESLDPRFRVRETVEEPMLIHGIGARGRARGQIVTRWSGPGSPRPSCTWTATRTSCPAASASGSRSPRRWCSARTCWWRTSPCPCSTSRSAPGC